MGLPTMRKELESALKAFVTAPPVVGALYVMGLAAWAGQRSASDVGEIGDERRAEAFDVFVARRYADELMRMRIGIIATAIAFGIVLGLAAEVLVRLRHPPSRIGRRSLAGALVESALVVMVLHTCVVAWSMADSPQLYAAHWYALGGFPRTVQIVITDVLGTKGVILGAMLLAIAYVRPVRVAYVFRRGLGLVRKPLRAVGAIGILLAIASALFGEPPAPAKKDVPAEEDKRPNVLILATDSLRADRLDPRVAPNLAKLANEGTRFDRAYVSLPRTFPSWVTILTGRHGHHHGIRSMFPTWEERAKDFDALPQRFAKAGYATTVVSDYAGDIFGRIDLGFQRVDTPTFDFRQLIRQRALERETPLLPVLHSQVGRRLFPVMRQLNDAADPNLLAEDISAALRAVRKKPFFMTVFFSTAHFPYAAPAPYYSKYTDSKYRGRYKYHKPVSLERSVELPPDADDIRQIQGLYDGTVSAVDDAIGRVLKTLDRLGLSEKTIIVITADHGEALYDHGHGQGHGDHLFGDEVTHVPLVIYDPRQAKSRREASIVRDIDLAPTLYELTSITPPSDLDGRSLAPALRGEPLDRRFAYAESEIWFNEDIPSLPAELRMPYPGILGLTEIDSRHNTEIVLRREMQPPTLMARHRMVRDERFKLVYVPTRLGVRYFLFDTKNDPGETNDVSTQLPDEVARLRTELWSWMLQDPLMEQKDGFLVPRESAFAKAGAK